MKVNIDQYIEQVASVGWTKDSAKLFVVLVRELAAGRPVPRMAVADILNWSAGTLADTLEHSTGIEYDDHGNIVGYGLTLRKTAHVFEFNGRRLYAWCALDTLMFPMLIGGTASVSSRCAETGTPIALTVSPDGIQEVQPVGTALSLVLPQEVGDIRQSFCCHVHFFASVKAAEAWAATRQRLSIVSVEEGFAIGRELGRRLL